MSEPTAEHRTLAHKLWMTVCEREAFEGEFLIAAALAAVEERGRLAGREEAKALIEVARAYVESPHYSGSWSALKRAVAALSPQTQTEATDG